MPRSTTAKDSLGKVVPGINGPSGRAGIRDADDTLAALLAWLKANGLDKTTDVFVTADHGFSTIDKHSATSAAARYEDADDNPLRAVDTENAPLPANRRDLPAGFLAIDLADSLGLPLCDPHLHATVDFKHAHHPAYGDGFIGKDPDHPDVMVIDNGGSDLIYVPGSDAKARAAQIVDLLTREDYVSGIFVDDELGDIPGQPADERDQLARHGADAAARHRGQFRVASRSPDASRQLMCAAEVADTPLATGQGMHGNVQPRRYAQLHGGHRPRLQSPLRRPSAGQQCRHQPDHWRGVLGLTIPARGGLKGRPIDEALKGGKPVAFTHGRQVSAPAANGAENGPRLPAASARRAISTRPGSLDGLWD